MMLFLTLFESSSKNSSYWRNFSLHSFVAVSLILEAALAANATASTSVNSGGGGKAKKSGEAEAKNKRQIDQFLGSPGASIGSSLGYDAEQGLQAYPLQFTQGIYNQPQRLPLYTRHPAGNSKSPEIDAIEQEQRLQSQQQVCSRNQLFLSPSGHCKSPNKPACTLQSIAHKIDICN